MVSQLKLTSKLVNCQILLIRNVSSSQSIRYQQAVTVTAKPSASTAADPNWDHARPFSEIPSASTFTMMCNFLPGGRYYKKESTQLMLALKADYGDMFLWPKMLGREQMLFTHNPKDFEVLYRNEGVWPVRPAIETIDYHRTVHRADFYNGVEGIVSSQGQKWGKFRSTVNPVLMQPKNIKLYLNRMSSVNKEFVERIKQVRNTETLEVPENFVEEINRWTLESISIVALDKQLGLLTDNRDSPEAKQAFNNLNAFFSLTYEFEFQPSIWKIIPTPKFKRLLKVLDDIQAFNSKYINEAMERLEKEKLTNNEKPESEQSILEKLLKIDKKIAIVMSMDLLMAGVDTTSSTFAGIMLCLAKNPAKQTKLREEIMRILPEKSSEFTEQSIKNLPYLRACIKESLRLYPLVSANGRVPQKDVVLSGYQIPKGTQVSMISTSLLRDDKHYPRANEFLPERWLRPENMPQGLSISECPNALKANNPFIYLPFGFGPRMCIGKRIVELELELGVSRIIRNFYVEFNHSTENAFKSLMINMPNIPLQFKFTDVEN